MLCSLKVIKRGSGSLRDTAIFEQPAIQCQDEIEKWCASCDEDVTAEEEIN